MALVRIAWFSPFPPVQTGIAGRSAELVSALRARGYRIDPYPESSAHDFPWRHRLEAYDLIVYQFGNSSHHDYEWPYALQYPGLVALHDTHLHHARASLLLREERVADYRVEFHWNHPDVPGDAAEVAIAGFDSRQYYEWPMVRALVESARLTVVHGEGTRRELAGTLTPSEPPPDNPTSHPTPISQRTGEIASRIVSIRLGEGELVTPERERAARARVRATYGIPDAAVLFGGFGGLTPEKRIPQVLAALRAILPYAPGARLILGGAPAAHYSPAADVAALGLGDRVTLAGYIETDEALTDHLAACDVSLNLRWPTARETSGPWLRALAAGRATIVTELAHVTVPSLDPRTWAVNSADHRSSDPVCVAIDILDEDHSLRLAMRRLAADASLREQLGRAGREWWTREHTVDAMADDYERVMEEAMRRPLPAVELPPHMRNRADRVLTTLLGPFGRAATERIREI
jgi:glycosyltransferase involved in cell wall biosynthesis